MWTFIFLVAAVFFAIGCLKWKVSTLDLIYYMEKNRHKVPSKEEMKECTGFVVKNMIKYLTHWAGSH